MPSSSPWFDYPVRVYPHHTDYAGVVWHGSYIAWMEEARVEWLRTQGVSYADLVEIGCDLPVVELSIRYRRPLRMGMDALVRTRILTPTGVRINWEYSIQSPDCCTTYTTATVTLVPIDRDRGKIMVQVPPVLEVAFNSCFG